jgi:hypothetical protein
MQFTSNNPVCKFNKALSGRMCHWGLLVFLGDQERSKAMQRKGTKRFPLLSAITFMISIAACAPVKPADPAYLWASGKWGGKTGSEAILRVKNGNQLTGWFTYLGLTGVTSEGTIISGMVDKEKDVDFVQGQIFWPSLGHTSTFRLGRVENARLIGDLSLPGELPWTVRNVDLMKAK